MVVVEGGGGERDWKRSREREGEGETERWRSAVKKNDLHLETKKKTFLSLVLSLVECSSFSKRIEKLLLLPSRASEIAEQSLVLSLPLSRAMTSPVKVKREKEKKEETHFVVDEPTIGTLRFPLSLSFACAVLSHLPFTPFVSPVKLSAHRNRSRTSARSSEEALEGARVRD